MIKGGGRGEGCININTDRQTETKTRGIVHR